MKADLRVKYSKSVIQTAFYDLLKEVPLEKITVTAICEKAQINRSTFYRYYTSPYDLEKQIEDGFIKEFLQYAEQYKSRGVQEAVKVMAQAIQKNKETFLLLIGDNVNSRFLYRIMKAGYETFSQGFSRRYAELSGQKKRWAYFYIAQGCMGIIVDWIENGMTTDVDELARFVAELDDLILMHTF